MKIFTCCFALILLLIPVTGTAVIVPGLYEVEVPVADQKDANRPDAVRTAMGLVLVKLTGDRYARGRTALAPIFEGAEDFVQQYRYKEETAVQSDVPGAVTSNLKLWVRFDEAALERTLRRLSVPVWGQERPVTLLWLVTEHDTGRSIISLEGDSDYLSVVDNRARMRGIALIFPLMDLEDTTRIRPSDIWGGFRQPVMEASNRYNADSVLTGSIASPVPGIWEGHWTAYLGERAHTWITRGDLPEMVLDEGIDGMADILASRYVNAGGIAAEETDVVLTVTDVHDVEQYATAMKYLRSLNSVTDVQVENIAQDTVVFRLKAHGGNTAVAQAIALGRRLQPVGNLDRSSYRLLPW
jgi:hypothetical protein